MSHLTDPEAARRLLNFLDSGVSGANTTDEVLDIQIPEYVRAELAGKDVKAIYPDVHAYILSNLSADDLYRHLLDVEQNLIEKSETSKDSLFKPDLSFLGLKRAETQTNWQAEIVEIAKRITRVIEKKKLLIDPFVRPFFERRPQLPDRLEIRRGTEHAFAALGSDAPEELRWLEAVYQTRALSVNASQSDLPRIAQEAAVNAGLPKKLRKKFADEYVKIVSDVKPTSR